MLRYLSSISNSRDFPQAPPPKASCTPTVSLSRYGSNSLFRNILRINHLNVIFCGELFLLAVCFQYFAEVNARGVFRREANRLNLALCSTATLVYGVRFAKPNKEFGRLNRILETDKPSQCSGRERNPRTEGLFAASGFGSPARTGRVAMFGLRHTRRAGPKPSTLRRDTFSGNPDTTQLDGQSPGSALDRRGSARGRQLTIE